MAFSPIINVFELVISLIVKNTCPHHTCQTADNFADWNVSNKSMLVTSTHDADHSYQASLQAVKRVEEVCFTSI